MERYGKYITIGEHVIVASVALAALNVVATDGLSGLRTSESDALLFAAL